MHYPTGSVCKASVLGNLRAAIFFYLLIAKSRPFDASISVHVPQRNDVSRNTRIQAFLQQRFEFLGFGRGSQILGSNPSPLLALLPPSNQVPYTFLLTLHYGRTTFPNSNPYGVNPLMTGWKFIITPISGLGRTNSRAKVGNLLA